MMKRHWEQYGVSYHLIDAQGWIRAILYREIQWHAVGLLGAGFDVGPEEFGVSQKHRLMRKMEAMLTKWERS